MEHENDPDIDEMPLVNLCFDLFAGCLLKVKLLLEMVYSDSLLITIDIVSSVLIMTTLDKCHIAIPYFLWDIK